VSPKIVDEVCLAGEIEGHGHPPEPSSCASGPDG
jgi:hypothetical protein